MIVVWVIIVAIALSGSLNAFQPTRIRKIPASIRMLFSEGPNIFNDGVEIGRDSNVEYPDLPDERQREAIEMTSSSSVMVNYILLVIHNHFILSLERLLLVLVLENLEYYRRD